MLSDPSWLLTPTVVHWVVLVGVLTVAAFRATRGTMYHRSRYLWVLIFLWSWGMSAPAPSHLALHWLETRHAFPEALPAEMEGQPVVVLSSWRGRALQDGPGLQLDVASWERTRMGVRLWERNGGTVIFSGGPIPWRETSVAENMAMVAKRMGVPAAQIHLEERSRDTYENLRFVAEDLLPPDTAFWLVTSAMHMPRAMAVAEALGLDARPFPADYRAVPSLWKRPTSWLPEVGVPVRWRWVFHELLGLVYYRLQGWA